MSSEQRKAGFDELGPVIGARVAGLLIVLFLFAVYLFDT
jgi:hypothetical protein